MDNSLAIHDLANRQLALDPTRSFIVKAPAGSGKTELLIQRFLTLLSRVEKPEEILAITFTNKAASEMRQRIINALHHAKTYPEPREDHAKKTWQLATDALQKDTSYGWHLLENPNRLRIQTIDAFCAFLTQQLPVISGMGSSPAIELSPLPLYQQAITHVFSHLNADDEWGQALRFALTHLDNDLNSLNNLLILMLAKRDQWLPYIHFNESDHAIRATLENTLKYIHFTALNQLRASFPVNFYQDINALLTYTANYLSLTPVELSRNRTQFSLHDDHCAELIVWRRISHLLLTKQHTWRKRIEKSMGFPALNTLKSKEEKALLTDMKARHKRIIDALIDNEGLRSDLVTLDRLPPLTYTDHDWRVLCSLLSVLKLSAAELRLTFQHYGKIDFIENALGATLSLSSQDTPSELALSLDYQIRHILFDEFQDTSLNQLNLLRKLTAGWQIDDGRTLFIVGDPMQSIYRFREAEVGIFLRIWQDGFEHIPITPMTLSLNFRSEQAIVQWNNEHYKCIFPASDDSLTSGVAYTPSTTLPTGTTNQSDIRIYQHNPDSENSQEKMLISNVMALLQTNPDETIAILVRSRSHLNSLIPMLHAAQIKFQAIDIDPLGDRPCIQDLFSLTQALCHLGDRIAWLSILRSPCSGLSLSDLCLLSGDSKNSTLWLNMQNKNILRGLSDHGQSVMARIIPILREAIRNKDRESLLTVVEETWCQLGYPATLSDPQERTHVDAYFNLLKNHQPETIDTLKQAIMKLYAPSDQSSANIHLMTIHSSKGLEFDTVILPHLEKSILNRDKPLLNWLDIPFSQQHIGFIMAPLQTESTEQVSIFQYIKQQQAVKASEETKRLLYVATTRAKKRLHLHYSAKSDDNGDIRCHQDSFLGTLCPSLLHNEMIIINDKVNLDEVSWRENALIRLIKDWRSPHPTRQTATTLHRKSGGFALPDDSAKIIGSIYHQLTEKIHRFSPAWWQMMTNVQQRRYLKHRLIRLGASLATLEFSIDKLMHLTNNTLNDRFGNWLLMQPHAKIEYPISTFIRGVQEKLVIDMLFTDENGVRWIVDYKTAESGAQNKEAFIQAEYEKYREKMHSYAAAINAMEVRPTKLALYFASLPAHYLWEWRVE